VDGPGGVCQRYGPLGVRATELFLVGEVDSPGARREGVRRSPVYWVTVTASP